MKKYDAYFDMITPIKYLNNKDSFTIARVIDGLHCIELHISNGVSTIEKGIRLWKLFDYNFGEENGKEF